MTGSAVRFQHISVHVETAQRFAQAIREAEAREGRDWSRSAFLDRLMAADEALRAHARPGPGRRYSTHS